MADPKLWKLYFFLFDPPEDPGARELYSRVFGGPPGDPKARRLYRRAFPVLNDPTALSPRRQRLLVEYRSLFQQPSESDRPWEPPRASSKDPYILAYRYKQFTEEINIRRRVYDDHNGSSGKEGKPTPYADTPNPYYESLLANYDDPPQHADDDLSRAIRYAKDHYESFYEVGQVDMIVNMLNRQRDLERRSYLEDKKNASLARLYGMASLAEEINESLERIKGELEDGDSGRDDKPDVHIDLKGWDSF